MTTSVSAADDRLKSAPPDSDRADALARAATRIGAPAHLLRYWLARFSVQAAHASAGSLDGPTIAALGGLKLLMWDGGWDADDVDLFIARHGGQALRDLAPTHLTGLTPDESRPTLEAKLQELRDIRAALTELGGASAPSPASPARFVRRFST